MLTIFFRAFVPLCCAFIGFMVGSIMTAAEWSKGRAAERSKHGEVRISDCQERFCALRDDKEAPNLYRTLRGETIEWRIVATGPEHAARLFIDGQPMGVVTQGKNEKLSAYFRRREQFAVAQVQSWAQRGRD